MLIVNGFSSTVKVCCQTIFVSDNCASFNLNPILSYFVTFLLNGFNKKS